MTVIANTAANLLLQALPGPEQLRITNRCDRVVLATDQLISKAGTRIRDVYFPTGSIFVRMARATPNGTIGVDLIGHEGVVGASLALGVDVSPLQVSVAEGGTALRVSNASFRDLLQVSPALEQQLHLSLYLQLRRSQQTIACAAFHLVERRLAYWLLMLHDRVQLDRIHLTHDRLALMLGVRRSGVSTAAGLLQRRKIISYSRGHIVVLNRQELEKSACSCYRKERTTARQIVAAVPSADDTGMLAPRIPPAPVAPLTPPLWAQN